MQRGLGAVLVLGFGVLAAACSPAPTPTPSPSLPATVPSPRPVGTPLAGPGTLEITGVARSTCVQPPGGCGYGVTLVLPDGAAHHAEFLSAVDGAPLLPGPGLPASLPPGTYALVFSTAAVSDVASMVPYDDGSMGPAPPDRSVACTARLPVGADEAVIRVRVVFEGNGCEAKVRRR